MKRRRLFLGKCRKLVLLSNYLTGLLHWLCHLFQRVSIYRQACFSVDLHDFLLFFHWYQQKNLSLKQCFLFKSFPDIPVSIESPAIRMFLFLLLLSVRVPFFFSVNFRGFVSSSFFWSVSMMIFFFVTHRFTCFFQENIYYSIFLS